MNRFGLLIVLLFGLASLSGPTMAASVAAGNFWTVANQELCVEQDVTRQSSSAYKLCSKKINGQVVPCQQLAGVMPLAVDCMFEQHSTAFSLLVKIGSPPLTNGGRFRPPQAA